MAGAGKLWARLSGGSDAGRENRAFLPAALEVLETPASPSGRTMGLAIGAFLLIAFLWAAIGRVDVIAAAPGRVMPFGKSKFIQSLEPGVVRAILVQDGQHVRAGQVLIELDDTLTGADRDRLVRDLALARLDLARLTALKRTAEAGAGPGRFVAPAGVGRDEAAEARAALVAQEAAQAARIHALDDQIAQKRAEAAEVAASMTKISASLPLLEQKEWLHKDLHDQGYGTTFSYLDSQQAVTEARNDLKVLAERGAQARAAQADLASQRSEAIAEFHAQTLADLVKAEERVNELSADLIKAGEKAGATRLRAPVDGVVEQLAVHTVGGVVTPAERLAEVVPEGGVMIEAQLPNREVGFVHRGQAVAIKVEAFDFTRYGLLRGVVADVSRDVQPPLDAPAALAGGGAASSAPAAAAYVARIAVDRATIEVDGHREPLMPGMAVTVEIKTGRRSVLDYLLSPIARKTSEAMHER